MKSLLLVTAALALGTTAASAETFTFTGKNTPVSQVAGPGPMGKPIVAGNSKNEIDIVWASGTKEHSSGECFGWSAPPASGFTSQGACSGDSPSGKAFSVFSCLANDKGTESDCWGRVTFTSGKNAGKTATISWHGKQNADGKGGTSVGAGNMN